MHIGIVTTWFERGAAYVSKQFQDILSKEHSVYIYARGGEQYAIGDPNWDKPNVWWAKRENSPFNSTYINKKDFIKWITKNHIELIIFNEQQWFMPLIWCKELGIKTLAYIDYYTKQTIPLFDIYDGLICNTKRHYSAFEWHHNPYYVPWGTNIDLYRPATLDLLNKEAITYFHSAGMSGYRKGTDLFVKAYLRSNQTGRMIIHTQRDLKEQFPELAQPIDKLIQDGKLELITGTVTAPGLYHMGDVYIYPSRLDGIGLTIAESLAMGLACVVPDNGPMNEFVTEDCGRRIKIDKYFCREDAYYWPMCEVNIDQLAAVMDEMNGNPNMVKQMKVNARNYSECHLSQDKNFQFLNTIVKEVQFIPMDNSTKIKIFNYTNRGLARYEKIIMKVYPIWKLVKRISKQ